MAFGKQTTWMKNLASGYTYRITDGKIDAEAPSGRRSDLIYGYDRQPVKGVVALYRTELEDGRGCVGFIDDHARRYVINPDIPLCAERIPAYRHPGPERTAVTALTFTRPDNRGTFRYAIDDSDGYGNVRVCNERGLLLTFIVRDGDGKILSGVRGIEDQGVNLIFWVEDAADPRGFAAYRLSLSHHDKVFVSYQAGTAPNMPERPQPVPVPAAPKKPVYPIVPGTAPASLRHHFTPVMDSPYDGQGFIGLAPNRGNSPCRRCGEIHPHYTQGYTPDPNGPTQCVPVLFTEAWPWNEPTDHPQHNTICMRNGHDGTSPVLVWVTPTGKDTQLEQVIALAGTTPFDYDALLRAAETVTRPAYTGISESLKKVQEAFATAFAGRLSAQVKAQPWMPNADPVTPAEKEAAFRYCLGAGLSVEQATQVVFPINAKMKRVGFRARLTIVLSKVQGINYREGINEVERQARYYALRQGGMGESEARETVWPAPKPTAGTGLFGLFDTPTPSPFADADLVVGKVEGEWTSDDPMIGQEAAAKRETEIGIDPATGEDVTRQFVRSDAGYVIFDEVGPKNIKNATGFGHIEKTYDPILRPTNTREITITASLDERDEIRVDSEIDPIIRPVRGPLVLNVARRVVEGAIVAMTGALQLPRHEVLAALNNAIGDSMKTEVRMMERRTEKANIVEANKRFRLSDRGPIPGRPGQGGSR